MQQICELEVNVLGRGRRVQRRTSIEGRCLRGWVVPKDFPLVLLQSYFFTEDSTYPGNLNYFSYPCYLKFCLFLETVSNPQKSFK